MKQFKDPHTDQELQSLMNMLHLACLHSGGEAAHPVAIWQQKINAAKEVKPEKKPGQKKLKAVKDES